MAQQVFGEMVLHETWQAMVLCNDTCNVLLSHKSKMWYGVMCGDMCGVILTQMSKCGFSGCRDLCRRFVRASSDQQGS